jgi:ParB-like chromosome segregation protein Spo0J
MNHSTIEEYAILYTEDEDGVSTLPPLDVFAIDGAYVVAAGGHRLAAARQAHKTTVPCHIHAGTRRDAMLFAIFSNLRRGLPYQYGDKQRILERLLHDEEYAQKSDRALAREVGVSNVYVSRIRARLAEHRRLQETLQAIPTTVRGAQAQKAEQVATYLELPHATVQLAMEAQGKRPDDLVMDLVKAVEPGEVSPDEARRTVQARVQQAAARVTPRPTLSKEERAQERAKRQARKEAEARSEAEWAQRQARASRASAFLRPLEALARIRETQVPEDPDTVLLRHQRGLYTLAEMVACIEEEQVPYVTALLQQAPEVLEAMAQAWQARMKAPRELDGGHTPATETPQGHEKEPGAEDRPQDVRPTSMLGKLCKNGHEHGTTGQSLYPIRKDGSRGQCMKCHAEAQKAPRTEAAATA